MMLFLFICFLPTVLSKATLLEKETIELSAIKCCDKRRVDCCVDSVTFGKPLTNCDFGGNSEAIRYVYKCLQEQLFPQELERMSLDDGQCCRVFGADENDPNLWCEKACKSVMTSPSLSRKERLLRIEKCRTGKNPIFECFSKCLVKQSEGFKMSVLKLDEVCDVELFSKAPQLRP